MELEHFLQPSVKLTPKTVLGVRTGIVGNVNVTYNQEIIYPVESVFTLYDNETGRQRNLRIQEKNIPLIIAMDAKRKIMAVLENVLNTYNYNISIYDLVACKKRRNITLPFTTIEHQVVQMLFTQDTKTIIILTASPDDWLYIISLEKLTTIIKFRPAIPDFEGCATCVACFQDDSSLMMVAGIGFVSYIRKEDKEFHIANTVKGNFHISSLAYLESDLILLGTMTNEIVLIDNGEIKMRLRAVDMDSLDFISESNVTDRYSYTNVGPALDQRVLNLLYFPKGFAYTIFNNIFVFKQMTKTKYQRKTIITLPITTYDEHLYQIQNVAVDLKQEFIVVTANHAQVYISQLFLPEDSRSRYVQMQPLIALTHIEEIIDLSICAWKSIIMTASKDQSVRIWNYETNKMELVRKYQVDISVVELAATGLIAAIGFSDQLRIAQIFLDELNYVKTYNFPRVKFVTYSSLGHLLAVAYDNIITLTSTYCLEIVTHLRGHSGIVQCLVFTKTDKYLLSAGVDGAIYQWDIETGNRVVEIVEKGSIYMSIAVNKTEPFKIYAATSHGTIRQFQDGLLARELPMSNKDKAPITDICLSSSDKMIFAGTTLGELFNVSTPFTEAGGGQIEEHNFFLNSITKIRFSYDCSLLIVTSSGGTLVIYALANIEQLVAPYESKLLQSREILIPRHVLNEKDEQIRSLELRLKQQVDEFQYQVSQNDIFGGQQLAEVHKMYWTALEQLKKLNESMQQTHMTEMNEITTTMEEVKSNYSHDMNALTEQYSDRMYTEFLKFNRLEESLKNIHEDYEKKMSKSTSELQETVEVLDDKFGCILNYRRDLIRDLMNEIFDRKVEFTEYCRQVEEENQQNDEKYVTHMENQIEIERARKLLWRGKSGCLWKKYQVLLQNSNSYVEEVVILKEENQKSFKKIEKLLQLIEELQKDVSDRDYAIKSKEKRIGKLLRRNQEMDKFKGVFHHKINELKSEIEPKEFLIMDKKKQIYELENSLENLNTKNFQLERTVNNRKSKYMYNCTELHNQVQKTKAAANRIDAISRDIFTAVSKINVPQELQTAVKELYDKYADRIELKRAIDSDALVQQEFTRQQNSMLNRVNKFKEQIENQKNDSTEMALMQENMKLIEEIEYLQKTNATLRDKAKNLFRAIDRKKLENTEDAKKQIEINQRIAELTTGRKLLQENEKLAQESKWLVTSDDSLTEKLNRDNELSSKKSHAEYELLFYKGEMESFDTMKKFDKNEQHFSKEQMENLDKNGNEQSAKSTLVETELQFYKGEIKNEQSYRNMFSRNQALLYRTVKRNPSREDYELASRRKLLVNELQFYKGEMQTLDEDKKLFSIKNQDENDNLISTKTELAKNKPTFSNKQNKNLDKDVKEQLIETELQFYRGDMPNPDNDDDGNKPQNSDVKENFGEFKNSLGSFEEK